MLAARSRREPKQGLRRGAGVALHREQEATERVYRTREIPGCRRSPAVARPSTRASFFRLERVAITRVFCHSPSSFRDLPRHSVVARKTIRIVNRSRNAFLSPTSPMATWLQKTFQLPGPELAFVDAVQEGDRVPIRYSTIGVVSSARSAEPSSGKLSR